MDELTYLFISAVINAIMTGFGIYLGFRMGVQKTVDLIIDRLQKRYSENSNAKELVNSVSSFFRNMDELMRSSEVKTLICDVSTLLRQLSTPPPKRKVKKLQQ
jgi:hypothetical protein